MLLPLPAALLFFGILTGCSSPQENQTTEVYQIVNPEQNTLQSRFNPPEGFIRTEETKGSFASYLRELPLKQHGAQVKMFDGRIKQNNNVYAAVVYLSIGTRDLHQCADAVMRLRAEYLWNMKEYDKIHFNFTNGFQVNYSKWMQGYSISVTGNDVKWVKSTTPSNTYQDFWKYMEIIFSYAGTLSLEKELQPQDLSNMKIGDVFIRGGSPGHAVIVVDMAVDTITKQKVFMLAQSYMPAQELQILVNPSSQNSNPWYSASFSGMLNTPEWAFARNQLRAFKEE